MKLGLSIQCRVDYYSQDILSLIKYNREACQ